MADKVSFSGEHLKLLDISRYYQDSESALRHYFDERCSSYEIRFSGYSKSEVRDELSSRLAELDKSSALNILSSLEASFRIDFLVRCYYKRKDKLSRRFRDIYRNKGSRISLEEDILENWKDVYPEKKGLLSDLIGAFKYRHWLAHGRYWMPKIGKKFDYYSLYLLAETVYRELTIESN